MSILSLPARLGVFLSGLVLLLSAAGCARPGESPAVLAAASMQEAIEAAADAYARTGHPRPQLSFAASSALARQIAAGAPADLFVSADEAWMDRLAADGAIAADSRAVLAGNRLVLVAGPAYRGGPVDIAGGLAAALGDEGRLAVGDPAGVPAGRYAEQALRRLGAWESVASRLAPAESVRAALALVERGAAPLGIVYATDARAAPRVRVVGMFPAGSHAPIRYPIARLTRSDSDGGEAFRRYLLSEEGRAILAAHGFLLQ